MKSNYNLAGMIGIGLLFCTACGGNGSNPPENSNDTLTTHTESRPEPTEKAGIKGTAGYLYVDDGGNGSIPLLFIHSFGGDTHQWDIQLQYFRKERRAIAMDLRGHGQSEAPAANQYGIDEQAGDIAAVVDSLGLSKFVLVGHSMGGSAAIDYAAKHPDKVAGLVLTGTPGKIPPAQYKPILSSLEADSSYQKVMDAYMKKLLTNAKPAVATEVTNGFKKIPKDVTVTIIRNNFEFDPVPALKQYKGPALIISGDADKQPGSLHQFFPAIPQVEISGTSHWIQLDKPDEFNKALEDFLKKIH